MACFEQNPASGAGMTEYLLSRGTWKNPYDNQHMPDSENACGCDGQVSGSDFHPQSTGPDKPNF